MSTLLQIIDEAADTDDKNEFLALYYSSHSAFETAFIRYYDKHVLTIENLYDRWTAYCNMPTLLLNDYDSPDEINAVADFVAEHTDALDQTSRQEVEFDFFTYLYYHQDFDRVDSASIQNFYFVIDNLIDEIKETGTTRHKMEYNFEAIRTYRSTPITLPMVEQWMKQLIDKRVGSVSFDWYTY